MKPVVSSAVESTKVKAFQEPGYTNVWYVQDDATGLTIAKLPINKDAEAWAHRIVAALNAQLPITTYPTAQIIETGSPSGAVIHGIQTIQDFAAL